MDTVYIYLNKLAIHTLAIERYKNLIWNLLFVCDVNTIANNQIQNVV